MGSTFSVGQVNEYIRMLLDGAPVLGDIWVVGEISNFKNHYSTGHMYFSLKDSDSMIKCVMFRSSAQRLRFAPEDGMRVLIHGRVSSYVPRGEYQIYADSMQPDGVGALALAYEQLKARLGAEGLFSSEHKKPIPKMPRRVGVITSASGAAIHDIINVSGRRSPQTEIVIYPAQVQGELAAKSLCGGIRYFNERSPVDVIIIGRGGGSIEDLWAFNDEELARLIYASEIPVISAVGHETDFTICDLVADLRAPTPSAAAEIAFADMSEMSLLLSQRRRMLEVSMTRRHDAQRGALDALGARLKGASPYAALNQRMARLALIGERLDGQCGVVLDRCSHRLSVLCARLEAANPLALTSRGYAVVQKDGRAVLRASQLSNGEKIDIHFADGCVSARVEDLSEVNDNG